MKSGFPSFYQQNIEPIQIEKENLRPRLTSVDNLVSWPRCASFSSSYWRIQAIFLLMGNNDI